MTAMPSTPAEPVSGPTRPQAGPLGGDEGLTVTARARRMLGDRGVQGSLSLMISAAGAGVLALVFWSLTARTTSPATVGVIAAEVSTVSFLAGVGSLNLINVFARFLPEAGRLAGRMILIGYACAALAGSAVAGLFLLTPWARDLVIGGGPGAVAFVALVVVNSVFMIQDGGLVGLGHPLWVPAENLLVAIARLGLLPLAATSIGGSGGLLVAWAVPMALSVLVLNALMLTRLAPAQAVRRHRLPSRRDLTRFVAIESVTTAVTSSVSAFLPALVKQRLGAAAGGFFYVPWVIATMITLLLSSTLLSTVRELVDRPEAARHTLRRARLLAAAVVGAAMTACLVAPGLILWPLGPQYVQQGTPLLRWVALALPAITVNLMYWATCLVRRRAWPVFWINLVTGTATVLGVLALGPDAGIARVGMVHFVVQTVVLLPMIRSLRAMTHGQVPR
jgi:O-antigen/teichoic acid export membrane protein